MGKRHYNNIVAFAILKYQLSGVLSLYYAFITNFHQ